MKVKQSFETGEIGYLVLFVFIAGAIGDMFVNFMTSIKKFPFTKRRFAQGLIPYYNSLKIGNTPFKKLISSIILGAILGGIACVVALLLGELFMYAKESLQ